MPMISVSKAAKLFKVSRPTLQRALKSGLISGEKSSEGGVELWQIDTAELARLYTLRDPEAATLPRHETENEQLRDVPKSSENRDLAGEAAKRLEEQLQALKQELAAERAVSGELRRICDDMLKALPRPADQTRPRRGFWDRLRGR